MRACPMAMRRGPRPAHTPLSLPRTACRIQPSLHSSAHRYALVRGHRHADPVLTGVLRWARTCARTATSVSYPSAIDTLSRRRPRYRSSTTLPRPHRPSLPLPRHPSPSLPVDIPLPLQISFVAPPSHMHRSSIHPSPTPIALSLRYPDLPRALDWPATTSNATSSSVTTTLDRDAHQAQHHNTSIATLRTKARLMPKRNTTRTTTRGPHTAVEVGSCFAATSSPDDLYPSQLQVLTVHGNVSVPAGCCLIFRPQTILIRQQWISTTKRVLSSRRCRVLLRRK
ncbi:hypothetical protein B0H13DRAFT_2653072 [Mycena leptocephala]|nr:hypothetical protein B0H13DRAFT_2653072 [Mycena leptocephala]